MGIFSLTRFGSPSGDEGMAREGNVVTETRASLDPPTGGTRDGQGDKRQESRPRGSRSHGGRGRDDRQQGSRQGSRTDQDEWLRKQKEELKFQKESLDKAVEKDISGESGERQTSHVTVKPGPRRPRGRGR
jgi:hypothetical protein